jgi:SagB-type dehydrogenase family enzyme
MPDDSPSVAWAFHRGTVHAHQTTLQGTPRSPSVPPDATFWHPGQMKEYPSAPRRFLPPPEPVPAALGEAISQRASCRRFADVTLPLPRLSTLLQHGYGLGEPYGLANWTAFNRPVPSGGGCYPLELYLFARRVDGLEEGTYHYCVQKHALELLGPAPSPITINELFLGQPWLMAAQAVVVVTGVPARLLHRYGERGYRYLLLEAGHVGQNLTLVASATGCASLCLGGFFDDELARLLGLDPRVELPIYAVAIGVPESTDRFEGRGLEALGV